MKQVNKNLKKIRVTIAELSQQKLANALPGISSSLIAAYEDRGTNIPTDKIEIYLNHFNDTYGTAIDWNMIMSEDLEKKNKEYFFNEKNDDSKIDELRELIEELNLTNSELQTQKEALNLQLLRHEKTIDSFNFLIQKRDQ